MGALALSAIAASSGEDGSEDGGLPSVPATDPLPQGGERLPAPNYVPPRPAPPEWIDLCEKAEETGEWGGFGIPRGTCEIILAAFRGDLEPGWYSDEELDAAVERANK